MKRYVCLAIVLVTLTGLAFAQKPQFDRVAVPLSDPTKPAFINIGLMNGSITVTGYSGKEVIIEATTEMEKLEEKSEKGEKAKGMKRIVYNTSGLEVEEEDNVIDISTQSWKRTVNISLKIPVKANLELSTMNNGDIVVENVEGELEINNMTGKVTLRNVSGSVVAHSMSGDLIVILTKVTANKVMSFSTMSGDVDVTLPANVRANIKMKSGQGDIYSDFDISMKPTTKKTVSEKGKGGKFKIKFDEYLMGALNGGGPEFTFKTFSGDIYIRKGK